MLRKRNRGIELDLGVLFFGSWSRALVKFVFVGIAFATSVVTRNDSLSYFALAIVFLASNAFDYIYVFLDGRKHPRVRRLAVVMFFFGILFLVLCILPLIADSLMRWYQSYGLRQLEVKKWAITFFAALYVIIPLIDFARHCPSFIDATDKYVKPQKTGYSATSKMLGS